MREILRKLSISKDRINVLLIIFFFILLFASILYYFFTQDIVYITVPAPNNSYIKIGFSGYELFSMTINSILNNENIKEELYNSTYVDKEVDEVNNLLYSNKKYYKYYFFYQSQFSYLYPTKYFILCIGRSCNSFFLGYDGIIKVNKSLINTSKYMIIYVHPEYFNNLMTLLKDNKTGYIIPYFRYGLEYGYIKIANDKLLVKNILKYYNYTYK